MIIKVIKLSRLSLIAQSYSHSFYILQFQTNSTQIFQQKQNFQTNFYKSFSPTSNIILQQLQAYFKSLLMILQYLFVLTTTVMGNNAIKRQILHTIDKEKPDKLIYILQKHPQFINQQINQDNYHTPLIQAVWQQNYTISRILLADFNCDPNKISGDISPLIAAAIKDNVDLIDLLIQFKANIKQPNLQGLTAIDFAILYGSYHAANHLHFKYSMKIGVDAQKYQSLSEKYNIQHVNHSKMITLLIEGTPLKTFPGLILKKQSVIIKKDSVKLSNIIRKQLKKEKSNPRSLNERALQQIGGQTFIHNRKQDELTLQLNRGKLTEQTQDQSPMNSQVQQ